MTNILLGFSLNEKIANCSSIWRWWLDEVPKMKNGWKLFGRWRVGCWRRRVMLVILKWDMCPKISV